jgi:hypothetical protein
MPILYIKKLDMSMILGVFMIKKYPALSEERAGLRVGRQGGLI